MAWPVISGQGSGMSVRPLSAVRDGGSWQSSTDIAECAAPKYGTAGSVLPPVWSWGKRASGL